MVFSPLLNQVVTRRARAKINLALAVGPRRREDGLHPICSWFAPIDLVDELKVTRLEPDRLSRYAILWHEEAIKTSPIDWSITKDLAVRAHLALEKHVVRQLPVQMKLDKRIPVGSGLGGGSADAAAMLSALRELFDLDLSDEDLARIGLEVGSDVPFFLGDGSAIVESVGEIIERTRTPGGAVVLIVPDVGCNTAVVYARFDDEPSNPMRADSVRTMARSGTINPAALFNDLAAAAMRVEPALSDIRDRAHELVQLPVHLTGSGSALFIACPAGLAQAQPLVDRLSSDLRGCAVVALRLG